MTGSLPHELRFKTEFYQVLGRHPVQELFFFFLGGHLGPEADLLLAEALLDNPFQAVEGPADNEKDVAGVEDALFFFAGAAVLLDGLDLGNGVMGDLEVHFGLLHGFEQGPLHPGAGDVRPPKGPRRGDFVDLIDINNAVLGHLQVVVGGVHQVPHQVFHVPAHISRLAEFGGVPLDKGHPQLVGDELDEVGFAHPGGADEDDVVLDGPHPGFGFPALFQVMADAVEMGADLGGQDALGVFLLDDVFVEKGFQFLRLQIKVNVTEFVGRASPLGLGVRFGHPVRGDHLDAVAVFFGKIVAELFFQLFLVGYFGHGFLVPIQR
jgi:hypothetical protein